MKPNKQDGGAGAASSLPSDADFEGYYAHAMQFGVFGDPSSSQQQPPHRAAASSTPLNPPQLLAQPLLPPQAPSYGGVEPYLGGHIRGLAYDPWQPHFPQQASSYGGVELYPAGHIRGLAYDPWRPQFPQQASSYGGVEPYPAGNIGGLAYGSLHMNAPAARTPSMAPRWSDLSASDEEFRFRPISLSHLSEIPSTSQNGNGTSALLRNLRAHPATHQLMWHDDDVLALLLDRRRELTDPALLMSAESSGHVVKLLAEGDDWVRQNVLRIAKRVVHRLMKSREGNGVFVALLRACNASPRRSEELKDIINAVCNGKGFLGSVVQDNLGRKALQELIKVVAGEEYLRQRLIHALFVERALEQSKGRELLRHCFAALPYDHEIITQHALVAFDMLLSSPSGWKCLKVCLMYATSGRLRDLEENIVLQTSVIAKDQHSHRLLCYVLDQGSEQFKVRIAERVGANIVELSVHEWGHYVVQACIVRQAHPPVLRRVLSAFLDLHMDALEELVRGFRSSYVVVKLLTEGKQSFPEITTALAMRIKTLLPVWLPQPGEHADRVRQAIGRLYVRDIGQI